ncbi:antibiotic biosynthesis monooxygenase [Jiella sp. MQZ9-1]|uniref:Antibiotic biosynthesis monooxygenase n=1 Tax=Jiella flava TaxID=2816857 RepID=A0A939JY98_9HYPH|nr:putative quinol monooxygenase [Jiella flava]MBO0664191.1 antibiotic biosynthesis monooxygenase [Jiella flava]MCD2472838.1 antibiotic biosynthesis monooxygenase [Jiella flava]
MVIVSGILRLSPEDLAKVRGAATAVLTATRAEAGCLVYSFAEDLLEPGLVRIYEEWESRETLQAHGRSAHIADWHGALSAVTILDRDLKITEAGRAELLA